MNRKKQWFLISLVIITIVSIAPGPNGDIFRFMKDYVVKADQEIGGTVFILGGNLTIEKDATVMGDALVIFGDLKVNGRVNGNIGTVFGNADISSSASIIGDSGVIYGKLNAAEGSILGESAVIQAPANFSSGDFLPLITTTVIAAVVAMYLISCLIYLLFPKRIRNVAISIKSNLGRKFLIGLLINIALIPLIIVLVITVVGVFIIPLVIIAYILLNMFANVALALMVGKKISGDNKEENAGNSYIYLLSGVLVVFIISIIPVLGWFAYAAGGCIALGATIDTRLGEVV